MSLPLVAIVGRPNVGKSSLLNVLAGRRVSIVDPTAGVTRDRVQTLCEHNDVFFEAVDTGGYGIVDRDDLSEHVERQIRYAVAEASLLLFVVDARDGVTPLDERVVEWLRTSEKPVLLIANKVDAPNMVTEIADFNRLGLGEPLPISAMNRQGIDDLRDRIIEHVGATDGEKPSDPVMHIALVGKRNVGKSSFINALAGRDRVIVSEVAGTTRDAVDVQFERDGHRFVAIDTAGVRKRTKLADSIEFYSFHRAELSIRRADVVLFLNDAIQSVSQVDKKLARYIADQYKPCIIVINKWDLAKDRAATEDYGEYLLKVLPGIDYAPVVFTTATEAKNVQAAIDVAASIFKQSNTRVGTGELNQTIEGFASERSPSPKRGERALKVYYGTQVAVRPPTFVMFVNDPARVTENYERFMLNRIRESLPFKEVPIRLLYRGRRAMQRHRAQPNAKH